MYCFGTYLTHAHSCDNVRVHSATQWTASVHTLHMPKAVHVQSATGRTASVHTHAQSCDNVHVQSATDWAALVHTLHMPKAVIKFVFEVYGMDCFGTYLTHAQICDNVRVQSTTEWIVFSPFSRFRRFRVFVFSRFRAWRFRVFVFRRRHPRGRDTDFVCTATNVSPDVFLASIHQNPEIFPQVQQLHELLEDSGVALVKSVGLGQFTRCFLFQGTVDGRNPAPVDR